MGIKLDLEPKDLDVIMTQLQVGRWCDVNNTIGEILKQANDSGRQEVTNAIQDPQTSPYNGGSGPQPGVRQEGGNSAESGQGIQ